MSADVYAFICTKQTASVHVPAFSATEADHRRSVKNAFSAISGGFRTVGQIAWFPRATAVQDHLLCDGSTVTKDQFPQLVEYLAPGETSATIPDYLSGVTFPTSAPTQTVSDGGSVVIGETPAPSPTPTGGQTGGSGGNVSSGGRPRNPAEQIP